MDVTLITGLDGSGKSTLLKKIKEGSQGSCEIIFLPKIDTESLRDNVKLFKTATFINLMNDDADRSADTSLKAVAIFSSMLLFRKILEHFMLRLPEKIFCERHPLTDTLIYAGFYVKKLHKNIADQNLYSHYEKYLEEMGYIYQLLPEEYRTENVSIRNIAKFIVKWFFEEGKTDFKHLEKLFGIGLPDRIYFLRAKPEVLYQRIKDRMVKEAHELPDILAELDNAYVNLLKKIEEKSKTMVSIVDSENLENLDILATQLTNKQ